MQESKEIGMAQPSTGAKEVIVQFHHISYLEFQSISSVSIQSRQSRSAAVLAILHSFDSTKCTGVVDLLPGAFLFAKPKSIVGFGATFEPSMNYFFHRASTALLYVQVPNESHIPLSVQELGHLGRNI